MRYKQVEKMESIRKVEKLKLSIKRTLRELDINRSTFYQWYRRYCIDGYDGLANRSSSPNKFWNKIPPPVRRQVVDITLKEPDKSPRELA